MPLYLRNPHSVLAALETRPQDVYEVRIPERGANEAWERVRKSALDVGIKVLAPKPARPGRQKGTSGRRAENAEAVVRERPEADLEDVLGGGQGVSQGLWIGIDTVQDPRNLGSIVRSAAFFGARGLVLTRDRTAPLSGIVYDVASGGMEHLPFASVPNLSRALGLAKERGLWILGTSEHADRDAADLAPDRPWMLLLGNEESGLRRLTLEKCDEVCRIPARGAVTSLNVSVAAGILIQRLAAASPG